MENCDDFAMVGSDSDSRSPLAGPRTGSVRYGFFDTPIGPIRPVDHQLRSPLGGFVSERERDDHFRSFQFIGAVAPDMAAGCAVTSSQDRLTAFAYLWAEGEFTELRLGSREDDVAEFAQDPDAGGTRLVTGRGSVAMIAEPGGGKRLVVQSDRLGLDIAFGDGEVDVLRLCTPTGPTGWAYVQKVAAVPAVGSARVGSTTIDLEAVDAQAHHDYTTGFLRPETWWHWACVAARLDDGRRLGLNLSCGTNESGYRENGAWIDDQWRPLAGALFDFDPDDIERPWIITSSDDSFELTFRSDHGYHARHDSETAAGNFHQLFGSFSGRLALADGTELVVRDLPGFAESQYLRW